MEALNPRQRGTLVEALGSAVFHGGTAIGDVPALLKRVLETSAWREFETPAHQVVTYDRFESFVTTPPTRGLGASVDLIRRIVADDLEALDLLDRALQNPVGSHEGNQYTIGIDNNVHNSNNEDERASPTGNTADAALRRLRKDRPDLHARVLSGELSPHGAMVAAGYRRRTLSLPVDDVGRLAESLKRHLTPEQFAALREAL